MDLRLAIPALCAWVGAAVLVGLPGMPLWVSLSLGAVAIALLATRRRALVMVAVCCAVLALLSVVIGIKSAERQPTFLLEAATASRHLSAEVTTTATAVPGTDYFAGTLHSVRIGAMTHSANVPVLVFATPEERIGIGATLTVSGTVKPGDPGDDVAFLFFADDPPRVTAEPAGLLAWGSGLRAGFADAAAGLPGDGARLLPGLAIGDTSAVDDELDTAMKASSLSHLTAVSGANCAVVVALAMLAGRALGIPRRWRIAGSIVVLVAFVVLVTPEPSVLRAAAMALLVLVAALSGRTVRGVPVLSAAVLALVVVDPWLGRNYGFVLSVLATGALIVLAEPLARLLERVVPAPLALVIAVPLSAQLACQPVLILLNPAIPVYGIAANLLAEPAAPVATVLGLAACAALPVVPAVGTVLAWIAWVPAAWIAAVARFFAGLPGAGVGWLGGLPGLALLVLLTAAVIAAALARGRPRAVATAVAVLLIVATAAATVSTRVTEQLSRPGDWQIAGCDVGQGDAFLVRSAGAMALIDTGPEPKAVAACLSTLGVNHLDLLVLTHYDLDHVGGSAAVEGMVDRVLVGPVDDPEDQMLRQDFAAAGARVEEASRGMTGRLGDLDWQVLWPTARQSGVEPGNDASVTMYFSCPSGCLDSLFLGDLGERAQSLLLAAGSLPPVTVVKVAHHGSADQDPRLYAEVHATVGAIGVGIDNDYGHPTQQLLNTLADVGTRPVRTDQDGLILLSPGDGAGTVSVWTQRVGPDG